ncbi:MAG: DUF262 domain-containing HNH endonuclease family protein [Acidimicrobiia bacterium]|nr:DUF262 domain-containing HNH endonuclease family protein [Acidimicrobiia bacterium]
MSPQTVFQHDSPTLGHLISQGGQCFYVPTYQRGFTWGSEQIERLFEDLYAGVDRVALGDYPAAFLGSVIFFAGKNAVEPKKANALPTEVLHVVDGQQRLTTSLLMCSVLMRAAHQVLAELEATHVPDAERDPTTTWLEEILQHLQGRLIDALHFDDGRGEAEYRLKPRMIRQATDVWGNNETDARYESDLAWYLHAIAKARTAAGENEPVVSPHRPKLMLALKLIESAVAAIEAGEVDCSALGELAYVNNDDACGRLLERPERAPLDASSFSELQRRGTRLATIASFVLSHVRVIEVRAPDEEYAFTLFEPLNTTGQPLTPVETLRPLVVQAEGGSASFMGSPSAVHLEIVDRYLPEDLGADQRVRRLDALITSFALVERGEKVGRGLLQQRAFLRRPFEAPARTSLQEKRAFSQGLATTATFLNDVWDDDAPPMALLGTEHTHLCLEVLATTRHTIALPLLIRFYEKAEETREPTDVEGFQHVLRSVTAFWALWRTARTTTSGIDSVHRRLIRDGHADTGLPRLARAETSHQDLPTAVEVQSALRNVLLRKLRVASPEDWVNMVASQSVYQTAKALAKYVLLLAHDDAIEDSDSPGHCRRGTSGYASTLDVATWKAHYTIEHIAPQSFDASDASYERAIYDDGLVDRLGNLLLLPAGINQAIGNRPWQDKRVIYRMLSNPDPEERQNELENAGLTTIGRKGRELIESASYMPFCQFVGSLPADLPLSADFVRERARNLAELAWERLWSDLSDGPLGTDP